MLEEESHGRVVCAHSGAVHVGSPRVVRGPTFGYHDQAASPKTEAVTEFFTHLVRHGQGRDRAVHGERRDSNVLRRFCGRTLITPPRGLSMSAMRKMVMERAMGSISRMDVLPPCAA